jgi:isoprenylcysteine carboxyl methyltransferase (ICMT) family protein YpbQ
LRFCRRSGTYNHCAVRVLDLVILALWALFWVYWLASAVGTKSSRSGSNMSTGIGLRLVAFLLIVLLVRTNVITADSFGAIANPTVRFVGFGLFILGLALAVWARLFLGRNWGTPMSEKVDPTLVTTGPYRYIRHPIYSGLILAMVGTALAVTIYWLIVALLAGSYFVYSAIVEERNMTRLFPATYPAYKKSTHMLVPFIL